MLVGLESVNRSRLSSVSLGIYDIAFFGDGNYIAIIACYWKQEVSIVPQQIPHILLIKQTDEWSLELRTLKELPKLSHFPRQQSWELADDEVCSHPQHVPDCDATKGFSVLPTVTSCHWLKTNQIVSSV